MRNPVIGRLHPLASFCYVASMLVISMFCPHPAIIVTSIVSAFFLAFSLEIGRRTARSLRYFLLFCCMIPLISPLFNHRGKHVLFYLLDNPITAEAFWAGALSALTLLSVLLWLQIAAYMLPMNRILYLFSGFAGSICMLITMTARFVPLFVRRGRQIEQTQLALGKSGKAKSARLRSSLKNLSILMTWSMEDGVDTADSMRARGYGAGRRTFYQTYRFRPESILWICFTVPLTMFIVICTGGGWIPYNLYENLFFSFDRPFWITFTAFCILGFSPALFLLIEKINWSRKS